MSNAAATDGCTWPTVPTFCPPASSSAARPGSRPDLAGPRPAPPAPAADAADAVLALPAAALGLGQVDARRLEERDLAVLMARVRGERLEQARAQGRAQGLGLGAHPVGD